MKILAGTVSHAHALEKYESLSNFWDLSPILSGEDHRKAGDIFMELKASKLSKIYGSGGNQVVALNQVDLENASGDFDFATVPWLAMVEATGLSIGACLIATCIPLREISRINIVEAIMAL